MTAEIGDNSGRAELTRRAKGIAALLDQIADIQEEVKQLKAEAKADGYDMRALGKVIAELRKPPDYMVKQLQLEMVLDTYRESVGLPTTIEEAQRRSLDDMGRELRDGRGA